MTISLPRILHRWHQAYIAWGRECWARWTHWPLPIVRRTPWREGAVCVVYGSAYPQLPVARSIFHWHIGASPYEIRCDVPLTGWDSHCDDVCKHVIIHQAFYIPAADRERYARVLRDHTKTIVLAMQEALRSIRPVGLDGSLASYAGPTGELVDTSWALRTALTNGVPPCFTIPLDHSTIRCPLARTEVNMRLPWRWMWHARQRITAGTMLLAIRIKWRRLADAICRIGARVLPDDKATFLAMRASLQTDMGNPERAIQLYQEIMKERLADEGGTAL